MKVKLLLISAMLLIPIGLLLLLPDVAHAASCTSTQSGNWNIAATWDCALVPGFGDDVVIAGTDTVTLTIAADIDNLTINPGGTLINQANTLSIANAGALINNGTFNEGTGTVFFAGSGSVAGTITFNAVTLAGAVNFGPASTVNGTFQINPGGSVITNAPTYGNASTLIYNMGGTVAAGTEWTAGATTGQGVPRSVQISNATALDLGAANRTATGNITITAGTTLTSTSGTLSIGGNLTNSNVFTHSNGTITFNGSGTQNISGSLSFYNLTLDSGTLQPDVAMNLPISGNWTHNGGTFIHNNSTVVFTGNQTHIFSGASIFNNVTIESGDTVRLAANADFGYANTFTLNGTFDLLTNTPTTLRIAGSTTLPTGVTTLHNLAINAGATLTAPAGVLEIGGNWTNAGIFTHNNGTVIFNGTSQSINTSNTIFYKVIVDSTALTLNGPVTINNTVTISPSKTLNGGSSTLTISDGGLLENSGGTFNGDTGTAVFAKTGTVSGTAILFNNVTLQDGGVNFGTVLSSTVNGTLTLESNSFIDTNPVRYGSASTLRYDTGGTIVPLLEWTPIVLSGPSVPNNVSIASGTTLNLNGFDWTATGDMTIDLGGTLESTTGNLNIGGAWSNSGTFTHNNGVVTFNGAVTQTININPTTFYNLNSNPAASVTLNTNITVNETFTITTGSFNAGSQTITMSTGSTLKRTGGTFNEDTGKVSFSGVGTVTGVFTFYDVSVAGAVTFNSSWTINHILQINGGGSINTNFPTYGTSSTLQYNTGGYILATANEWTPVVTSGPTVPYNVQISGNTTLDLDGVDRTIRDNLTIDVGSTLKSTISNLNIAGNVTNNGTFDANGGTITFNGTVTQTISGAATSFYHLNSSNTAGVTYNTDIVVSNTLTITIGSLNAGSQTLTMGDGSSFKNVGGTFNAGTGTIAFAGSGAVTGTVAFYNVTVAGAVDFGPNSTIVNILQINGGGSVNTNPPTYGASSALIYNTGGAFAAGTEWTPVASTGPGVPQTVQISNTTTLNLGTAARTALGDMIVNVGSTLNGTSDTLNLGGNWTNNGSFNPGIGTVTFNGTFSQVIGGVTAPMFFNLTISNTAATPNDATDVDPIAAVTVTNLLTVNDGQFQPDNGSTFKDITINSQGILKPNAGVGITVSGNWINNSSDFIPNNGTVFFNGLTTISGSNNISFTYVVISSTNTLTGTNLNMNISADLTNNGTFNNNSGTITFNGSGAQAIVGAFSFHNLTVDNTALAPSDSVDVDPVSVVHVQNNLIVNDGQFQPASNSTFKHVTINSNGIFKPDTPGFISGSGNWTNDGTYIHNNTILIFNGTTIISGTVTTIFNELRLINGADVDANTAIIVEGQVNVINGHLKPANGTMFNHVQIFVTGAMTPKTGASITVGGIWTNNGIFNPTNNSVTFNGTVMPQSMSGPATVFNTLVISNAAGVALNSNITITNALVLSSGLLSNSAAKNITLNDNTTIVRAAGSLAASPQFGLTVNIVYTGTTGTTTGPEIPIIPTILGNLTVHNTSGVTLTANATVNGNFTLNAGTFGVATHILTLKSSAAVVGGSSITSDATGTVIYDQGSDGQVVLPGNYGNLTFSNFNKILPSSGVVAIRSTFTPGVATGHTIAGSTIEYNGATAQALPAGFNPYHNLFLNNAAGTSGFAGLTVNNLIQVKSGIFTSSSTYNHVQIDAGATLAASANSVINISGNLTNDGTFLPSNGIVIFTGNSTIGGTKTISFNNVTITSTAQVTGHSLTMDFSGSMTNSGIYNHNNGTVTFNGSTVQSLAANAAIVFNNLIVSSGTTLLETVTTDNASVAGVLTNQGVIRKSKPVLATGTLAFGLTGVTYTVTTQGSLSNVQIDRIGANHPNAPSAVQTGEYWQFTPTGGSYSTTVTLPHMLADQSDAAVCHYSGSGTNWDCVRNSSTANSVTRDGVPQLASDWAVGNFSLADLQVIKKVNGMDQFAANKGDTITYTITVINHDPSIVSGVKIIDQLPLSTTFVSASTTHGVYTDTTGVWDLVTSLGSNASALLTIAVTVDITVTMPITNTALITASDQSDFNISNNQDIAILTAGGPSIYLPVLLKNN